MSLTNSQKKSDYAKNSGNLNLNLLLRTMISLDLVSFALISLFEKKMSAQSAMLVVDQDTVNKVV